MSHTLLLLLRRYSVGPRRTLRLSTSTLHYNMYKGKVEVAHRRYGHIQPPIHIALTVQNMHTTMVERYIIEKISPGSGHSRHSTICMLETDSYYVVFTILAAAA